MYSLSHKNTRDPEKFSTPHITKNLLRIIDFSSLFFSGGVFVVLYVTKNKPEKSDDGSFLHAIKCQDEKH